MNTAKLLKIQLCFAAYGTMKRLTTQWNQSLIHPGMFSSTIMHLFV